MNKKPKIPPIGSKVKIKSKNKSFNGILIERPKLSDDRYVIIKLDSGYNIGIMKNEIEEINLLKKPESNKKEDKPKVIKKDRINKKTVVIISTGGTISSKVNYKTGGVYSAFTAEDLLNSCPELTDFADIKTINLMNVMSEDMNPVLWVKLADTLKKELSSKDVDGAVITHGTDTMAYTSAALSFMLKGLGKPIVMTGSQRSSDRGSSDSFINLICSVILAASDYSGVSVVMHGSMSDDFCYAHNGTRVRKMHTTRRDAFMSIDSKPLLKIFPDGRIEKVSTVVPNRTNSETKTKTVLEEKVALVKIHPGITPDIIDFYIDKDYKGIIFEGTALGHVPTTIKARSFLPGIEKAKKRGIILAMTSQCIYGRVNPYVYSNLRKVSSRGVIYCEDMVPETAFVKLMWVLGQTKDEKIVREMMLTNYAGEISEKSRIDQKIGF